MKQCKQQTASAAAGEVSEFNVVYKNKSQNEIFLSSHTQSHSHANTLGRQKVFMPYRCVKIDNKKYKKKKQRKTQTISMSTRSKAKRRCGLRVAPSTIPQSPLSKEPHCLFPQSLVPHSPLAVPIPHPSSHVQFQPQRQFQFPFFLSAAREDRREAKRLHKT